MISLLVCYMSYVRNDGQTFIYLFDEYELQSGKEARGNLKPFIF